MISTNHTIASSNSNLRKYFLERLHDISMKLVLCKIEKIEIVPALQILEHWKNEIIFSNFFRGMRAEDLS